MSNTFILMTNIVGHLFLPNNKKLRIFDTAIWNTNKISVIKMAKKIKWYHRGYIQETAFFIAMFILTMLHEWIRVDTIPGFFKGMAFFLVLYAQAQLHRFFVFPLFLQKRYGVYAVVTVFSTLAGALLLYAGDYYWLEPDFYHETGVWVSIVYHFVICIISTITIMSLFLIRQYSIELQRRNQDQLLLSEMNIKFLHAQLNPHFFFNMFNNLYGVSLTDPPRVPDLILKLSKLMRYQLENGSKAVVSIHDEVKFIENYIVMEKERIGKRCDISFVFPHDPALLSRYHIAPLILITLVENAFKHSLTIINKWFVSILIELTRDTLCIDIRNSLPDVALKNQFTGIGLDNIRQRLELLYKGHCQFETSHNEKEYHIRLAIHLNCL